MDFSPKVKSLQVLHAFTSWMSRWLLSPPRITLFFAKAHWHTIRSPRLSFKSNVYLLSETLGGWSHFFRSQEIFIQMYTTQRLLRCWRWIHRTRVFYSYNGKPFLLRWQVVRYTWAFRIALFDLISFTFIQFESLNFHSKSSLAFKQKVTASK